MLIRGLQYWTATEVIREIGVTRMTFWRWRKTGVIPRGALYRDRTVIFTFEELEAIRNYSTRIDTVS